MTVEVSQSSYRFSQHHMMKAGFTTMLVLSILSSIAFAALVVKHDTLKAFYKKSKKICLLSSIGTLCLWFCTCLFWFLLKKNPSENQPLEKQYASNPKVLDQPLKKACPHDWSSSSFTKLYEAIIEKDDASSLQKIFDTYKQRPEAYSLSSVLVSAQYTLSRLAKKMLPMAICRGKKQCVEFLLKYNTEITSTLLDQAKEYPEISKLLIQTAVHDLDQPQILLSTSNPLKHFLDKPLLEKEEKAILAKIKETKTLPPSVPLRILRHICSHSSLDTPLILEALSQAKQIFETKTHQRTLLCYKQWVLENFLKEKKLDALEAFIKIYGKDRSLASTYKTACYEVLKLLHIDPVKHCQILLKLLNAQFSFIVAKPVESIETNSSYAPSIISYVSKMPPASPSLAEPNLDETIASYFVLIPKDLLSPVLKKLIEKGFNPHFFHSSGVSFFSFLKAKNSPLVPALTPFCYPTDTLHKAFSQASCLVTSKQSPKHFFQTFPLLKPSTPLNRDKVSLLDLAFQYKRYDLIIQIPYDPCYHYLGFNELFDPLSLSDQELKPLALHLKEVLLSHFSDKQRSFALRQLKQKNYTQTLEALNLCEAYFSSLGSTRI